MPLVFSVHAEPNEDNTKLKQAISLRKLGNYTDAVSLLSQLRSVNFDHKRINIELALNYIKLQQYQDAEQIIQHLQSLSLSAKELTTIQKITRLLEQKLSQTLSVHNYSLDLGLALGLDQTTNSYAVYVYDDFQMQEDYWYEVDDESYLSVDDEYDYVEYIETEDYWDREQVSEQSEVSYQRLFINGNYRYRPAQRVMLFGYPTLLTLDNDLTLDRKNYNHQSTNEHTNYQLNSSLYLLQIDRWLMELNVQGSIHQRASQQILQKVRARLALTIPLGAAKIKFAIDRQRNDYHQLLQAHDASTTTPWLELSYRVSTQFRLLAGYKYRQQRARDEFNSYDNQQRYIGVYYIPSTVFNAYFIMRTEQLHYLIDDTELVNWANEQKHSFAFGLGYQINSNVSLNINADLGEKTLELDFGEDDWRRVEASIVYHF